MTLLTTVFAAVISTAVWYKSEEARKMKTSCLCWMFWGASLMWLGDAIFEYAELKADYFTPAPADMLNDLFLGLSVIALALVIWIVILLVTDPKGVVREQLFKKK
ncbi:MAG: hypothetical protein MJ172_06250 [Clostridia bacterium]|nr:hypothetical protein [Clostridia bacterium]